VPLPPELRKKYEAAHYAVFGEPELVFHIGQPHADLDALLEYHESTTAAFVTAFNPYGERQSEEDNEAAHQDLHHSEWLSGCATYEGEGRDAAGKHREASLLVVGIPHEDAAALGEELGQNAIVFIEKGKAPALVDLT
jgi:hypothetical protein